MVAVRLANARSNSATQRSAVSRDPSFAAPIYATLAQADEEGEAFNLIWSR